MLHDKCFKNRLYVVASPNLTKFPEMIGLRIGEKNVCISLQHLGDKGFMFIVDLNKNTFYLINETILRKRRNM